LLKSENKAKPVIEVLITELQILISQSSEWVGIMYWSWLGQKWTDYQAQIWTMVQSHKSSQSWMVDLIKKLWNIVWDMWEHCNGALYQMDAA